MSQPTSAMPHPAPAPDPARAVTMSAEAAQEKRDREAFEAWAESDGIGYDCETDHHGTYLYANTARARNAFLAGAAHGRAEAERDCEPLNGGMRLVMEQRDAAKSELTDARHRLATARADLRDASNVANSLRLDRDRIKARLERVKAERDKARLADPSHPAYRMGMDDAERQLAPPAALKERVVEAAMAEYREMVRDGIEPIPGRDSAPNRTYRACAALDAAPATQPEEPWSMVQRARSMLARDSRGNGKEACDLLDAALDRAATPKPSDAEATTETCSPPFETYADLLGPHPLRGLAADRRDAATPKPTDAVREAAGRLRAFLRGSPGSLWLTGDGHADLRAVLDALGEKGA